MTEDNVIEFCQWLVSEKGIEAGNLSDYINNNEEEVLKLAEEFKKPKFKVGGKVEAAAEMFKCGGKAKKKVKKHADGDPITIPVKLDETRTGTVTYNPDGTRKETIRRTTEQWQGTASPSEAVTHRVVTPDSTAMYVQYGPVDEENRRGYLYNTARNMGAREKANQAKFDDRFNELFRRANFRVTTLPNGKMVINDVVHTDNDTLSRTIDQGDTTIVNSAGDRFSNNSIKTRLARKVFGTSAYDQANKNFEMIDEMQRGGRIYNRDLGRKNKLEAGIDGNTAVDYGTARGASNQGAKIAKAKAVKGFENATFIDPNDFDRSIYRQRKQDAKDMGMTRRQRKAYALTDAKMPQLRPNLSSGLGFNQDDVDRVNENLQKVNIPIIKPEIVNTKMNVADNFDFNWGDIPINIIPVTGKKRLDKAGWDQFMYEVSNHANKSGAWRPNQDGIRWQRWNEIQYGKYLADPENFVWENMPSWFNDRNLTRSQPVKGVGYVDPDVSYIKFDSNVNPLPGKKRESSKTVTSRNESVNIPVISGIPGRFGLYNGMKKGGKIK